MTNKIHLSIFNEDGSKLLQQYNSAVIPRIGETILIGSDPERGPESKLLVVDIIHNNVISNVGILTKEF